MSYRDLLRQFSGTMEKPPLDPEEMDLSLGLSLGGCISDVVESKLNERRLVRSSSVLSICPKLEQHLAESSTPYPARTCSLPVAAEKDRKRKEMQTLKRLEVKRKRSEKIMRNSSRPAAELDKGYGDRREDRLDVGVRGAGGSRTVAALMPPAVLKSSSSDFSGNMIRVEVPSGLINNTALVKSPFTVFPSTAKSNQKLLATVLTTSPALRSPKSLGENDEATKKMGSSSNSIVINESKIAEKKMLDDMPCVSTKGNGPNGKKIDGLLYKYKKGEEVKIVCVCHGKFLTPAEFIKHAGGVDVDHPLKHILEVQAKQKIISSIYAGIISTCSSFDEVTGTKCWQSRGFNFNEKKSNMKTCSSRCSSRCSSSITQGLVPFE
ncbi:Ninja-family protein 3 [Apostasia shenzhenica]|uniref:Ninja-family protein n=1 Tax=Apostasia shenzhenica TaxID=1088818 RepID=A0A2I0BDL6_9ASPA|nr:Ninja-family protein 3 [Apostasia shenzhenica]